MMGIEIDGKIQRLESRIAAAKRLLDAEEQFFRVLMDFDPKVLLLVTDVYLDGRSEFRGTIERFIESRSKALGERKANAAACLGKPKMEPFPVGSFVKAVCRPTDTAAFVKVIRGRDEANLCLVEYANGVQVAIAESNMEPA